MVRKHRKTVLLLAAAGIVLLPLLSLAAIGVHDVTSTTGSHEGACAECHNIAATAATRGWGRSTSGAPSTGWGAQVVTALCWTCHSSPNNANAHSVTATAMAVGAHGFLHANVPPHPKDCTVHDCTTLTNSNMPYTKGDLQCTSCHNVHNAASRPFNIKASVVALCDTCHPGRNTAVVGANNIGVGTPAYSTHPVGVLVQDISTNGTNQFKGTIDPSITTVFNAAPNYVLGGKWGIVGAAQPANNLSCETCHAVHGANSNGTAGGTITVGYNDLLAINNNAEATTIDNNALCEGCHYGGRAANVVGAAGTTDHPIDNSVGRAFYPTGTKLPSAWGASSGRIDRPAANFTNTDFNNSSGVGVPRCSSCHDAHGGISATSLLRGPIPTTTGSGQTGNAQWCWSCHGASIVVPQLHHSNNSTWGSSLIACSGCHGTTYTGGTIQQWSAHNGFANFAIAPDTSAGAVGTGTLYTTTANSTTYENLCEHCHDPLDPTVGNNRGGSYTSPVRPGQSFGASTNALPNRHGNTGGTQTHLTSALSLSTAAYIRDMNRTFNSHFRAGTTATDNSWGKTSTSANLNAAYRNVDIWSKYTNYGTGTPQNPQNISGSTGSWLVCESCHNLLTNSGADPTATDCATTGFQANLLVYKYEDDGSGQKSLNDSDGVLGKGGDGLCRGCHSSTKLTVSELGAPPVAKAYVHYPEAHTSNSTLYTYATTPYGRTTNTILASNNPGTGTCPERTTADNTTTNAPGLFSYPNANRLNCDSCHRPHNAEAHGNNGVATLTNTNQDTIQAYILEPGTVANDNMAKTQACIQCHRDRSTSQWQCLQ